MASFSRAGSRAASKINEIQVKDAMVMETGGLRSNSESLTGGFCRQPYALVDKIPPSVTTCKHLASDGKILLDTVATLFQPILGHEIRHTR